MRERAKKKNEERSELNHPLLVSNAIHPAREYRRFSFALRWVIAIAALYPNGPGCTKNWALAF